MRVQLLLESLFQLVGMGNTGSRSLVLKTNRGIQRQLEQGRRRSVHAECYLLRHSQSCPSCLAGGIESASVSGEGSDDGLQWKPELTVVDECARREDSDRAKRSVDWRDSHKGGPDAEHGGEKS